MAQVRGWLSVKQAAAALSMTPEAVYQLVKAQQLGDWTAGTVRLIRQADVDAYRARVAGKARPGPKAALAVTADDLSEREG